MMLKDMKSFKVSSHKNNKDHWWLRDGKDSKDGAEADDDADDADNSDDDDDSDHDDDDDAQRILCRFLSWVRSPLMLTHACSVV